MALGQQRTNRLQHPFSLVNPKSPAAYFAQKRLFAKGSRTAAIRGTSPASSAQGHPLAGSKIPLDKSAKGSNTSTLILLSKAADHDLLFLR
jgi:hypothetical protein